MTPSIAAVLLLPLLQTVPGGSEVARLQGDSLRLGDGFVRSWVEVDVAGAPLAVGVTLPDSVLASVPDEAVMLSLDLPRVRGMPFRHVLVDWNPAGHPPAGLYHHPHWDAHFYTISAAERRSIEAGETGLRPDGRYMPAGFVPVPDLGLYAFPEMGVHWVHEDAAELNGSTFDRTLIYGSHGERTIFVEPMFTTAFLQDRPDVAAPVPPPPAVHEAGYYPLRYVLRYEPRERGFRVSLEDFRWREGG